MVATSTLPQAGALRIRPLQPADADALCAAVQASRASLSRWLPWCTDDYGLQHAMDWIAFGQQAWSARREYPFGVFAADDAAVLGGVGLNQLDPAAQSANLGYWLHAAHRGRGIATAAAHAVADWGFATLGLQRIELLVEPDNHASLAVATRLGARHDTLLRGHLMHRGRPVDVLRLVLHPGDLRPAPAA